MNSCRFKPSETNCNGQFSKVRITITTFMSLKQEADKTENNQTIKALLEQEIEGLKQDIGKFENKVDRLEALLSKLNLEDSKRESEHITVQKAEHVPVDCKGRKLEIGDRVESIGAPYHHGTLVNLDDQWAYIRTKYSTKPRKKAPYNLLKKDE